MHFFSLFCEAMKLLISDFQGMRKMALWLSDETTNEARMRAARIWQRPQQNTRTQDKDIKMQRQNEVILPFLL